MSTVATELLAIRLGSSAQAVVARQAAASPRKRRPITKTAASRTASVSTVGRRAKKSSRPGPRTPSHCLAAWRAIALGTEPGVFELKCRTESLSVSPVATSRRA
ncbi:MAG: hypothetical protein DMF77_12980 [Acidobacteria bacterium]|nr:MAG: hypothetical protein DMF77_12980 [Acidobacteriota bacterium]